MIEVRDVWFKYDPDNPEEVEALRGIDLRIEKGDFVAIIGPNGSGKSTLAKHLNALLLPTRGDVLIAGMNTKSPDLLWDIRKTVGMVFQNPDNQIVATVVEEDVAFGPENLCIPSPEIRRRVEASLECVGLQEYRKVAPHNLSGGQKQRLAIAGILAMQPECIVLDEPTAMLDPTGRSEVVSTVRRLNREEKITVVYITHFMDEAVLADRVVVMNDGVIVADGEPRSLFERVDDIREWGLDVPPMAELGAMLREDGFAIPAGVLTVDEMVESLCRLN
ncbi:MAG TPA: energy-coupling factor transporter ATPase [Firmicutes bacterium]|nr:energy-coupling factor transporter ATPase [Bacillota bacterium]